MSETLLVGIDDGDASSRAVEMASKAALASGATLVVTHILEWSPYSFLTPEELEERHGRRKEELARAESAIVTPVVEALKSRGVNVKSEIRYGNVVEALCAVADETGAAQIFIGKTGTTNMVSRLFGSTAGSLAQMTPVAVTIVP